MFEFSATAALLSTEMLVGAALFFAGSRILHWTGAPRRWRARGDRCSRSLCRSVPPAAVGLIPAALLSSRIEVVAGSVSYGTLGAIAGVAGVAGAGVFLVAHCGRLEARGRFRSSRLQLRLGAGSLFLGTLATVTLIVLLRPPTADLGRLVLGLAGLLLAAAVGGLAAISHKPRPGGYFAVALHAFSVFLLVEAVTTGP